MIKIALLLFLFLVYVYASVQQEGLRNYNPITVVDSTTNLKKIYGVNVIKNDPNNVITLLTTPGNPLYDEKYTNMMTSDILLDMQYFNNASYLMFQITG